MRLRLGRKLPVCESGQFAVLSPCHLMTFPSVVGDSNHGVTIVAPFYLLDFLSS
jgi:hypothetical protein